MNTPTKTSIMIFAASLFLLASFPALAQESFKLTDYKNPDYTYRMLDFGFNLNGSNSLFKEDFNNGLYNSSALTRLNASLSPAYNARKNTSSYQGFQSARLGISPVCDHYRMTNQASILYEDKAKISNHSFEFDANSTNRFYNHKQKFIEVGLNLRSRLVVGTENFETTPKAYPDKYKTTQQNQNIVIYVPVMIGMGRIEEVQDARLAVYIIEDLEKSGDLTRKPDANEILELAHFITSIKNKRYFDQRLRHISEITAVDSLLDAMGLKARSGASYYTLLNDNWSHSAGPVRSSGNRLSFGFRPSLQFQSNVRINYFNDSIANQAHLSDFKNEFDGRRTTTGIQFFAHYAVEKPINLYWQNSSYFTAGYEIRNEIFKSKSLANNEVLNDESLQSTSQHLNISASNTVGYYPNSRTSILFGSTASYIHRFFEYPEDEDETYNFDPSLIIAAIYAMADYYVSPRMRFNLTLSSSAYFITEKRKGWGAEEEQKVQRNSLNTYLNAGFVYSIF